MKVRAFTILETIVTLVLTSIIVSMVYLFFIYMSKNSIEYNNLTMETLELQLFYSNLKEDVYRSDAITSQDGQNFTLVFYDGSPISYSIIGNQLFRKKEASYTSIPISSVSLKYVDSVVTESEISNIRSIKIISKLFENEVPLYVFKNYYQAAINVKS